MRESRNNVFKGIDERILISGGVDIASSMSNFRISSDGSLEKRPENNQVLNIGAAIEGIWKGKLDGEDVTVFSAGGELIKLYRDEGTFEVLGVIGTGHCEFFVFGGALYVMNGSTYTKLSGGVLSSVEGYIPTIAVSCTPDGAGTSFEQLNLLTDKRKQLFSADGISTEYKLAESDIRSVESVYCSGVEITGYTVDTSAGKITFALPPAEGLNSLEVIYSKSGNDRGLITGCRKAMPFGGNSDGRIFLWGNAAKPNCRFHSELANGIPSAEYFPVNNFTLIGNDEITCIVQQYNKQLIFTKNAAYYSYCELNTDSLGNVYSSFPVFNLNGEKGCLLLMNGCVIDNMPVTLCGDGLNVWESTSVENEKNAVCISGAISETAKLAITFGVDSGNVKLFDFPISRELFFYAGGTLNVYDYTNGRWYRYNGMDMDEYCVCGQELYYSKGAYLYVFSESESYCGNTVNCSYRSAYTNFGYVSGRFDLVGAYADVYIVGPVSAAIAFEDAAGRNCSRVYRFAAGESGARRLEIRPHLKRCGPVRLTVTLTGAGSLNINGFTVKTKKRERSSRSGI